MSTCYGIGVQSVADMHLKQLARTDYDVFDVIMKVLWGAKPFAKRCYPYSLVGITIASTVWMWSCRLVYVCCMHVTCRAHLCCLYVACMIHVCCM